MPQSSHIERIVLVHGAAHGAWCWELVSPILTSYGYDVQAFDLPGLGEDPTPPAQVHLDDYVRLIVDVLKSRNVPTLLLGHSMGGVPVSQAAERASELVSKIVYLSAVVLRSGESMASVSLLDLPQSASQALRPSSVAGAVEFDPERVQHIFYNRCAPEVVLKAKSRLKPQAEAPIHEPVVLSDERYGRVPKAYIVCTDDHAFPSTAQLWLCERASIERRRSIDSDHSPFFSAPQKLAELIHEEAGFGQ